MLSIDANTMESACTGSPNFLPDLMNSPYHTLVPLNFTTLASPPLTPQLVTTEITPTIMTGSFIAVGLHGPRRCSLA